MADRVEPIVGGGNVTTIPDKQSYAVSREVLEFEPWADGCIYILDRIGFEKRGYWVCDTSATPVAALEFAR